MQPVKVLVLTNNQILVSQIEEVAPMDIGDGDKFLSLRRVIPDLTFTGSVTGSSPNATFTG